MFLLHFVYAMFFNKCPRCHKGKVFKYPTYKLNKLVDMDAECAHCHLKYEPEPGYFYGAMYVSYAMTSGIFIVSYLLQIMYFQLPLMYFAGIMIAIIFLFFPFIVRWARIVWINFFVGYDPNWNKKTTP